jgi:predicted membrane-bound spermidine synthase
MFIAIVLLISYLIAVIVVGHGGLPIAFIVVVSPFFNSLFRTGAIIGWIGIVGLIFATFLLRSNLSKQLTYQFLASLMLYISWLVTAILGHNESGSFFSSFVLSAPFQITFLIVAYQFILQCKQMGLDSDSTP